MARWRALGWISLAELGALSLWFSASVVLPALLNLPDIFPPRYLMIGGALLGAAANGALVQIPPASPWPPLSPASRNPGPRPAHPRDTETRQ